MKTKQCTKCLKEFSLDFFHKQSDAKYGLSPSCKACKKKYKVQYHKENKDKIKEQNANWRRKNPDWHSNYYQTNKHEINTKHNKRLKKYYHNDINYKIKVLLRNRLNQLIHRKIDTTISLLGCDLDTFKEYMESKFIEGMSWENIGKWHIDHIKPCVSFDLTDPDQQRQCFHYTNLQPLWAIDNLRKATK